MRPEASIRFSSSVQNDNVLEALTQSDRILTEDAVRCRAVQDMLEFAAKHGFTLGEEVRIRDLIHEGHKY